MQKIKEKVNKGLHEGITLIALVITIVVLIILAGISINLIIGQNGLFRKAKQSVDEYDMAAKEEDRSLQSLQAQISEYDGTAEGKKQNSKNRALSGKTEGYTYKNPIIPKGFNAVDDGSGWYYVDENQTEVKGWNDGLVIEDLEGNQFVWVPVDGEKVRYEKNDISKKMNLADVSTDTSTYPEGVTSEEEQIDKYQGFYVARFEAGKIDAVNDEVVRWR